MNPSNGAAGSVGVRALPTPTAVVTAAPGYSPGDPRLMRIRQECAASDAPARLQGGLALTLGVGARVYFQRVGLKLLVIGAA